MASVCKYAKTRRYMLGNAKLYVPPTFSECAEALGDNFSIKAYSEVTELFFSAYLSKLSEEGRLAELSYLTEDPMVRDGFMSISELWAVTENDILSEMTEEFGSPSIS